MTSYFIPKRLIAILGLALLIPAAPVSAQFGFGFPNIGVVGGVKVDAAGVVRDASQQELGEELRQLRASVKAPTGTMAQATSLRMVSLKGLQQAIATAVEQDKPLAEELLFLAGLQRVEYVFAYPEQNDIVIAGPAEAWRVRDDGSVVGEKSGSPVLRLEDLLVALRTADQTQQEVISVSIDPTSEGEVRLRQLLSRMNGNDFNPKVADPLMKEAFGPQVVTLTAVPKDSRMAQTLVAADYQMKRLAMNLESSPVQGLPSYMEMIRNGGGSRKGAQPRWWMTTDFDSLLHSSDRLAWKVSGGKIQALSEDQYVSRNGQRTSTGEPNKMAEKWANLFTEKYEQLAQTHAVFGDLRNVIDLNVVAAIIRSQQMESLTGCDLSLLNGSGNRLNTPKWQVPQSLDPQCSFVHGRVGWTVSASGGVEINPWRIVAESAKVDDSVKTFHAKATPQQSHWWWN